MANKIKFTKEQVKELIKQSSYHDTFLVLNDISYLFNINPISPIRDILIYRHWKIENGVKVNIKGADVIYRSKVTNTNNLDEWIDKNWDEYNLGGIDD